MLKIRGPVLVGRRPDRDELEQPVAYALLDVGREFEAPGLDVALDERVQTRLEDRHLATVETRDLFLVYINADDVVAGFRHAGPGDEADVT